jgi:hypothetical protein
MPAAHALVKIIQTGFCQRPEFQPIRPAAA